jgi:hypothetical protein
MNCDLKEFELGLEAIKYIEKCLGSGNKLSQALLKVCDFKKGRVITVLPGFVNYEYINDFEVGILPKTLEAEARNATAEYGSHWTSVMVPEPSIISWLSTEVCRFLKAAATRLCIFENTLAKAGDSWISKEKPQIFTFNEEVYHFLLNQDAENEKIRDTIRSAECPLFIGVMTSLPSERSFPQSGQEVSLEDLEVLAEGTEKIVVGAYDGDGYLIWNRDLGTRREG